MFIVTGIVLVILQKGGRDKTYLISLVTDIYYRCWGCNAFDITPNNV